MCLLSSINKLRKEHVFHMVRERWMARLSACDWSRPTFGGGFLRRAFVLRGMSGEYLSNWDPRNCDKVTCVLVACALVSNLQADESRAASITCPSSVSLWQIVQLVVPLLHEKNVWGLLFSLAHMRMSHAGPATCELQEARAYQPTAVHGNAFRRQCCLLSHAPHLLASC